MPSFWLIPQKTCPINRHPLLYVLCFSHRLLTQTKTASCQLMSFGQHCTRPSTGPPQFRTHHHHQQLLQSKAPGPKWTKLQLSCLVRHRARALCLPRQTRQCHLLHCSSSSRKKSRTQNHWVQQVPAATAAAVLALKLTQLTLVSGLASAQLQHRTLVLSPAAATQAQLMLRLR
jgi:hypothetical protein